MSVKLRLFIAATALALAACASKSLETPPMEQTGKLKVHPGLLGQPAPAAEKPKDTPK